MKLHLIAPALMFVGLVACSNETSTPVGQTAAADPADTSTSAPPEDSFASELPDQITAEEIQARREAWVSGGTSRVAAAPASSRE